MGQHRSVQRHIANPRPDEDILTAAIIALARRFGRYGYRMIGDLLRRIGWKVNDKLRYGLLDVEIFYTLDEAKVLIENWRREYNTIRPHSSLGGRPPAPETMAWVPPEAMPPIASAAVLH